MRIEPVAILELLALFFCIKKYKKLSPTYFKWFLPLLLLTNIVEWGNYFKLFSYHHSNNWIYNIFNPIEFCFYGWLYYNYITNSVKRKIILYSCVVLIVAYLLNMLFIQGMVFFNSYTFLLGCLLMIYFTYLYFDQSIKSVSNTSITKTPFFWISVGVLFFYSGEFILWSFFQYFLTIKDFKGFRPLFHFFSPVLNAILYACISISFFYPQKQPNT